MAIVKKPSSGTLSFKVDEIYTQVSERRPLKVTSIGADAVKFVDYTTPTAPGEEVVLTLTKARVLVMQGGLIRQNW